MLLCTKCYSDFLLYIYILVYAMICYNIYMNGTGWGWAAKTIGKKTRRNN